MSAEIRLLLFAYMVSSLKAANTLFSYSDVLIRCILAGSKSVLLLGGVVTVSGQCATVHPIIAVGLL